jgi:hypothetical protein
MSTRIKLGPRRWVANPWSKDLTVALGELAAETSLSRRTHALLTSVVGSYIMLCAVPRRDREEVVRKIRQRSGDR